MILIAWRELTEIEFAHAKGTVANDITAFHLGQSIYILTTSTLAADLTADQKDWGTDRENWPAILYQYEPRGKDRSHKKPPRWTTSEGQLILDINDKPLLAFPELPVTISSQIEPAFLEAFTRSNQHIRMQDIRGRMLRDPTGVDNPPTVDRIRLATLSMKATRFREKNGMITWHDRDGSQAIRTYLDAFHGPDCLRDNSIRDSRCLLPHERKEMHLGNAGNFLHKTGGRKDVSESSKEKIRAVAIDQVRRSKRKFEQKHATNPNHEPGSTLEEDDYSDAEVTDTTANSADPHVKTTRARHSKRPKIAHGQDSKEVDNTVATDTMVPSTSYGVDNNLGYYGWTEQAEQSTNSNQHLCGVVDPTDLMTQAYTAEMSRDNPEPAQGTQPHGEIGLNLSGNGQQDFLRLEIADTDHARLVFQLLEPTRDAYTRYSKQLPPYSDPFTPYKTQWFEIQLEFNKYWATTDSHEPAPELPGLAEFGPSTAVWENLIEEPLDPSLYSELVDLVFGDLA